MVYFSPTKIKHQSVQRIRFPERRNSNTIHEHMKYKTAIHDNYCTYLNCDLLEAPREYVLHGLVPGLNSAPFWPHPMSMHLVAMPSSVSCCLLQRFKFHTQHPSTIWVASH